ncbi:PA domain-containing protein [Lentzea albidocapillata subsp. violacea]|uniref:PA domain-containing protein n=1 Tax=Lentzea albidocapillata subsp. violacea TaxID=128104 RepID=A0A1G9DQH9_9PSEU|nr:PA domain-containing protein [Lentzea albidocapillata]SDK66128.1 PA domain-containing protein [Lentzea albidocapillata subsp. violacea]
MPFGGTPNGGLTAPLRVVPEDGAPGCEASDFAGQDFKGSVALIRRGTCTFVAKYANAGAAAVIISDNVDDHLGNINREALGRNVSAAAHVIASYAVTTEGVHGVPSRAERAALR